MDKIHHGGELSQARRQFPHITSWLDLSTGIAPWSYPCENFPPEILRNLPDESLYNQAKLSAADYFQTPPDNLILGAGAQNFINLLPAIAKSFFGKDAVFFIPKITYGEYNFTAKKAGCDIHNYPSAKDFPNNSIVLLGNPNNPDGKKISLEQAEILANDLQGKGLLVIDEAFCDLSGDTIVGLYEKYENIIILKSFGKFFGMAGLRLGFAITSHAALREGFSQSLGSWAVSSPALFMAQQAYKDNNWITQQRRRIISMAEKMQDLFSAYKIVTNQGLFITVQSDEDIMQKLAEQGIYIRAFANYPNLYRIGLPAEDGELQRLKSAL